LQSIDTNKTGSQVTLSVSKLHAFRSAHDLHLLPSGPNFLDTIAWGYTTYQISGNPAATNTMNIVVTKTNNATVSLSVTNTGVSNLFGFTQQLLNAINKQRRPYRAPMELSPKI